MGHLYHGELLNNQRVIYLKNNVPNEVTKYDLGIPIHAERSLKLANFV